MVINESYERYKLHVKQRYQAIIIRLGNCCVECGAHIRLQLDHPYGRTWDIHAYSGLALIRMYETDERLGLLRVLCINCNSRDGAKRKNSGYVARWRQV